MKTIFFFILAALVTSAPAHATSYVPLGSPRIPGRAYMPIKPANRPMLPGLRPSNVELLQDSFMRKWSRKIGSTVRARAQISRLLNLGNPQVIYRANGYMAEALFLERNPQWGYVGKANASQNDVYCFVKGRPAPFTGQVKVHRGGDPGMYYRDMQRDFRAHRFFIPDDHVNGLRDYLRGRIRQFEAAGDVAAVEQARHDYSRIRGLGYTYRDINDATIEAAKRVRRETCMKYVSMGAAMGITFGSIVWQWSSGELTSDRALYLSFKSGSLMGTAALTDAILMAVKDGAWRGGLKGTVIIGIAVTAVDTVFLLHEYGWQASFSNRRFYEESVAGITAFSLGATLGGGVTLATLETGPWAFVWGAAAGFGGGVAGYVGGKTATRYIIDIIDPDFIHQQEIEVIAEAKANLDKRRVAVSQIGN